MVSVNLWILLGERFIHRSVTSLIFVDQLRLSSNEFEILFELSSEQKKFLINNFRFTSFF